MNNRAKPHGFITLGQFVTDWFRRLPETLTKSEVPNDPIVCLETELTLLEIQALMNQFRASTESANSETLKPFIRFLADRWSRVNGTVASYQETPTSQANVCCQKLAAGIAKTILHRKGISEDERLEYLCPTAVRQQVESDNQALKTATLSNVASLFENGEKLVEFLVRGLEPEKWGDFLQYCPKSALIKLFFEGDIDKNFERIISSDLLFTGDLLRDKAMLYCLTECYIKERESQKSYLGLFQGITGFRRESKLREARTLQNFLMDRQEPFSRIDNYLLEHKDEGKTHAALNRDRLGVIMAAIKRLANTDATLVAGATPAQP